MTAGELIARVDELRPNAYSAEQKLRWLRRLDGQILAEIWETHGALPPLKGEVAERSEVGGVVPGPTTPQSPPAAATAPLAGEPVPLHVVGDGVLHISIEKQEKPG